MESKQDICNITNCVEGSNESERLQQYKDSSLGQAKTREGR
jgi:hypothetical protein